MKKSLKSREHAFVAIERDLKNGEIPSVVLLCGREDYLTDHYARILQETFLEPASRQMDLTVLEGAEVTPDRIVSAWETLPLLSARRVISLPAFVDGRGRLPEYFQDQENAEDELASCLKEIPEGVLLLITAEKQVTTGDYKKQSDGRKLKKLQTMVNKAGGAVYDFTALSETQLRGFIAKRFRAAGKDCDPGTLRRIIRDTGYGSRYSEYDLFTLENDLRKLIACSGNSPRISEQDVAAVITAGSEINVFRMLDAIAANRKDQALISLNILFESGESEFGILSILTGQLELMLIARELQDEGAGRGGAASWLRKEEKVSEFRAKSVSDTASRFPVQQLRYMLSCACEIETQVKSGLMESRLALEYFIARI